jgi:hypothetical protein
VILVNLVTLLLFLAQDGKDERTVSGEVVNVEARTLNLSIKKDAAQVVKAALPVADNAAVIIDGKNAKLSDLKPGRIVRVVIRAGSVQRIESVQPASEKPAAKTEEKPAPKPEEKPARPFPIDESVVPKGEKLPDLGGRVLSLFPDGPTTLVTIRQVNEEIPFYLPKDAAITYVGLEKPDQKPTVGYLIYVWLKPGSKDTAAAVRFARAR